MLQTYLEFFTNPRRRHYPLLAAFILLLPALFVGYWGDDLIHAMIITNNIFTPGDDISLFELFSFVNGEPQRRAELQNLSMIPWWASTEFTWSFWRPLTELTHFFDYRFLAPQQELMHLHSVLYFIAILAVLPRLLQTLGLSASQTLLITFIFAVGNSHGLTIAWLCNRSALIAGLLVVLTLIFHDRSRHQTGYYLLSLSCLTLALMAGEIALSAGALLFAYALFIDARGFQRGFVALLPYLLIVAGWGAIYFTNGMGVHGQSSFYINPADYPGKFTLQLLDKVPLIVVSQLIPLPVDILARLIDPVRYPLIAVGYLLIAGLVVYCRYSRYRKVASFFLCSALLTIFPIAASVAQDRNLLLVSIGFAGLIGLMILEWLQGQRLQKAIASTLIVFHLILSPLTLPLMAYIPKLFAKPSIIRMQSFIEQADADKPVVVFGGDTMDILYLTPRLLVNGYKAPVGLWSITQANEAFSHQVIDTHTLELNSERGFFADSIQDIQEMVVDFSQQQTFVFEGMTLEASSFTEEQWPKKLTLRFAQPLSEINFLQWGKQGYTPIAIISTPTQ